MDCIQGVVDADCPDRVQVDSPWRKEASPRELDGWVTPASLGMFHPVWRC